MNFLLEPRRLTMRCSEPQPWRSVTERGSNPTGSVTACAPAMKPRTCRAFALRRCGHTGAFRAAVAELGVVRRLHRSRVMNALLSGVSREGNAERCSARLARAASCDAAGVTVFWRACDLSAAVRGDVARLPAARRSGSMPVVQSRVFHLRGEPTTPNNALQRTARIVPSECGAASARSLSFWSLGVASRPE